LKQPLALAFTFLLATLAFTATATLPASAGAEATIGPPPTFSSALGLPDNRVYEQVSPTDTNGNQAGSGTDQFFKGSHYALAAADGNSVLFEGTGPMGESAAGYNLFFVAQRSAAGWTTRSVLPRAQQSTEEIEGTLAVQPLYLDPSSDLSHVMFAARRGTFATPPNAKCGVTEGGVEGERQLYLGGPGPFVAATWLARPEIPNPIENCQLYGESGAPVGGTPDFSTVYFTFPGTLLPEDASRAPHAHGRNEGEVVEAWGFYEDREGTLREAGVLPDGSLDPFGAVPAASGHGRALIGNEVADDGERAFFVSPDPASCEQNGTPSPGQNNCTIDPPELYVRENGEKTVLVSRDTLLPEVGGLPASAPAGAIQMLNPAQQENNYASTDGSYVFASSDGSQAFFQSEDQLTSDAPEGPPGNMSPKTYDFDVDTGSLTYLPNVAGQIVVASEDGSSLAFVRPEAGGVPAELDLWSAGPGGGTVTPVTQLPGAGAEVSVARMSTDGSVVVFTTSSSLPGGFNSGGFKQIYRYDAPTHTLGCVSCAPAGVTPTGSAEMSPLQANEGNELLKYGRTGMVDERGVSSDGSRIFFDTPDPLVPQDSNTGSFVTTHGEVERQGRDVYAWENGVVYLISSGKSTHSAFFLDNSESGGDVFFATTEALTPGHTDGGYAVYDARVPQPGDSPPATAVPCEGSVCQGPPSVPSPLTPPASATFSGLGNPAPEVTPPTPAKTTAKTVKCKKGFTKKKNKCVKNKKKTKAKKASHNGRAK
jgi:hypothetical protein